MKNVLQRPDWYGIPQKQGELPKAAFRASARRSRRTVDRKEVQFRNGSSCRVIDASR